MATRQTGSEVNVSVADLWAIARRRFWWFAIPAGTGMAIALLLALALPAMYRAEAILAVEPQGIPQDIAKVTVTTPTEVRFNNLQLQILTRENMSDVIDKFGLFADHRDSTPREELIDDLRSRISIEPLPPAIVDPRKPVELNSFRISFQDRDPRIAAQVANRLANDFITANLRDRTSVAEGTSEFIAGELEKARKELAEVSQQVAAYKQENQGELPEQLVMNQQQLERYRMSLSDIQSRFETARGQAMLIRKQIDELRIASANSQDDPAVRRRRLEILLNEHRALGKTDRHPDVIQTRSEIELLDAVIAAQGEGERVASPEEGRLASELRTHEVNASVMAGDAERVKAEIAKLEQRIANTPRRAEELARMEKVFENLTLSIRDLQMRKVGADMGRQIELAQKGERFRIIESAQPPTVPVSPNRPLWFVAGTLLGVMSGLGLLALREITDTSFHCASDLQATLGLPVLASIPRVEIGAGGRRGSILSRLRASRVSADV